MNRTLKEELSLDNYNNRRKQSEKKKASKTPFIKKVME